MSESPANSSRGSCSTRNSTSGSAILSADTAKPGKAKNAANIIGSELYLFIAQQSPSIYDPSFMKTFRTRGGGVDQVRIYRAESNRSDILAVDWTEDIKVTSSVCARRVTISDAS